MQKKNEVKQVEQKNKLTESRKAPKAAGNSGFRKHNDIQFMKTEKLKNLNKKRL